MEHYLILTGCCQIAIKKKKKKTQLQLAQAQFHSVNTRMYGSFSK